MATSSSEISAAPARGRSCSGGPRRTMNGDGWAAPLIEAGSAAILI
jgi:hypothetical protein